VAAESLIREAVASLRAHAPFSEMTEADVAFVARHSLLQYFNDGEPILEPGSSLAPACFIVRQGAVEGSLPGEEGGAVLAPLVLGPGELFPIGSLIGRRPPRTRYVARKDLFCWRLERERFEELLERSAAFRNFCERRMGALMELSMQAVQASYSAQSAQRRLMNQPLQAMVRREPVSCTPHTPLSEALATMEREGTGAMLVSDVPLGLPVGILTRQDVIGRIVLPGVPLDSPIAQVMSQPVLVLPASATVADAMILMADRVIRHVPIVDGPSVIGMVTERDLFALQRRNLRQISDAIAQALAPERLVGVASDIREWSRSLVAQGMAAHHLTQLISRMNDQLTRRMIELLCPQHGVALEEFCWLAFGSEGREEQTIATDQDNGIVFDDDVSEGLRSRLLAMGQSVNAWLDRCGYPLCKGGIMAGNPQCCLSLSQWRSRFERWVSHGSPQDLLNASIFFDLRPLAGRLELGHQLQASIAPAVQASPRFQKLMSDNAQRNSPPRFLASGVLGRLMPESDTIDLKLHGTMPLVDGARLLTLAHGLIASSTMQRFQRLIEAGVTNPRDAQGWIDAFNFLQSLRLRVQHRPGQSGSAVDNPNLIQLEALSPLDHRILVEALRQVRGLQQRLALDYP
jgi:CBS domain-containing protein